MAGGGWSDLPLDLFSLIFSKLSLPQFLRSAAVCVSWSAAVGNLSARGRCVKFRGQSPWLVFYDDNPSAVVTFYALDEAREYTITVPDPPISDRIFLGSAHGWIITMDVRLGVQLLNPITGKQIDLPQVFPSEHSHPIRDTAGRLVGLRVPKRVRRFRNSDINIIIHSHLEQHHLKAILSADPSLGDGYTVALIQYPSRRVLFTRSGGQKWLELRSPIIIKTIVFHNGKLYVSDLSSVYFCDLDEARIQHFEMPRFRLIDRSLHSEELHYLFETPRGDLLSVWRQRDEDRTKTISVKVYRLIDEVEKKPRKRVESVDEEASMVQREEAKDLGDSIVFLGGRSPLCFSPRDFSLHLMPNSVYFMDDNYHLPMFLEIIWFRKILSPISSSVDNKINFVQLYWQPPSTSINL